jgi:hypothetical protein
VVARSSPNLASTRAAGTPDGACHAATRTYSPHHGDRTAAGRGTFGEASLGAARPRNPPDDPDMIDPTADPLDTDVEDADLFLGWDDEESELDGRPPWVHEGEAETCRVAAGGT